MEVVQELLGHEGRVWCASWSPDGLKIASCGEDRSVRIWKTSGEPKSTFTCVAVLDEGHTRTIRSCKWSPDGQLIATASFDGNVIVWQAQDNTFQQWDKLATLEGHDNEVKCISWSCDGVYLASCGRDKKIWIWEFILGGDFECAAVLEGHSQDVKTVAWHPSLPVLFSASYDDTIRVWKEENGDWHCARTLIGHSCTVWGLTTAKNGRCLVSSSGDLSVALWESDSSFDPTGNWKRCCSLSKVHDCPIYSVDFLAGVNLVATGGGDDKISLLSLELSYDGLSTLRVVQEKFHAHQGDVNCVSWNQSSGTLLSAGDDSVVKIWKVNF